MEQIIKLLAGELGQPQNYVNNVVTLLDEGNTIPFIARYRKEMHGAMDDTVLRDLADRLNYLRNLDKRREEVKRSIEEQGKLTEETPYPGHRGKREGVGAFGAAPLHTIPRLPRTHSGSGRLCKPRKGGGNHRRCPSGGQ